MHEYSVRYQEDEHHIDDGVRYLEAHLSRDEAKTLFEQAKDHHQSEFRSSSGHHYMLEHHTDGYTLTCLS